MSVKFDGTNYPCGNSISSFWLKKKAYRAISMDPTRYEVSDFKNSSKIDNSKLISWILGSVDANIKIPMHGYK